MKKFFILIFLCTLHLSTFSQIIINEIVADNDTGYQDAKGEYSDWIELHNSSNTSINIGGYYLSDDNSSPQKWSFPVTTIIPANGYLVVIASSEDTVINNEIHTNFSIKKGGEEILLSDVSGVLIEEIAAVELTSDIAYARIPDTNTWDFTTTPTFESENIITIPPCTETEPSVDVAPGIYPSAVNVTYSCPCTNQEVVEVDFAGNVLNTYPTGQIAITQNRVLRMACRSADMTIGNTKTDTYFINEVFALPVVSLSADYDDVFGQNGIYTKFNDDLEIVGHAEYYDVNGNEVFDQDLELEIHGSTSASFAQKSFRLTAKSYLGKSKIEGNIFEDRPYTDFKQLVLRNSGNDFNRLMYRDLLNHRVASETHIDWLAGRPVLVYVNGNFQGLYNIRERTKSDYLASVHGVDADQIDHLKNEEVKEGDNLHFYTTYNYIMAGNGSTPSGYNQIKSWIDIDNFIDYFVVETYHTNWDWPHNNVRFWRPKTTDGKWRFMYYDSDFGLHLFNEDRTSYTVNELERVLNATNSKYADMFKKLLEVDEFKCQFKARYKYLLQNVLTTDNYTQKMQALEDEITPELSRQFTKYNQQMACCRAQVVQNVTTFIQNRPAYALTYLESTIPSTNCDDGGDTVIVDNGGGDTVVVTPEPTFCQANLANQAINWTLTNDWNDSGSGSTISDVSTEVIDINQRNYGRGYFWLNYQNTTFDLVAGNTYNVSFVLKNSTTIDKVNSLEVAFTDGFSWQGPNNILENVIINAVEQNQDWSTYNATFTATQTTTAYLSIKMDFNKTQLSSAPVIGLKELGVCEENTNTPTLSIINNSSSFDAQIGNTQGEDYHFGVYTTNGNLEYEATGTGDNIITFGTSLTSGIYIAKVVTTHGSTFIRFNK